MSGKGRRMFNTSGPPRLAAATAPTPTTPLLTTSRRVRPLSSMRLPQMVWLAIAVFEVGHERVPFRRPLSRILPLTFGPGHPGNEIPVDGGAHPEARQPRAEQQEEFAAALTRSGVVRRLAPLLWSLKFPRRLVHRGGTALLRSPES